MYHPRRYPSSGPVRPPQRHRQSSSTGPGHAPTSRAEGISNVRSSSSKWSVESIRDQPISSLRFYDMIDRMSDIFVSVELTRLWRRHLVYSKRSGGELINLFTGRFAALTTMTTLLIGSEVAILFSPAQPSDKTRTALLEKQVGTIHFWAGFVLFINISVSIAALISILTAWSLNSVIDTNNAHILLRSSLWLHTSTLPSQLALSAIYLFVVTLCLFFHVIAAWEVALPIVILFFAGFTYLITLYSSAGRILMYSGAMGEERIVERNVEWELTPEELYSTLLKKSYLAKRANIHPKDQYRIKYQEQLEVLQEGGSLQLDNLRLLKSQYLGSDYAYLDSWPPEDVESQRSQESGQPPNDDLSKAN